MAWAAQETEEHSFLIASTLTGAEWILEASGGFLKGVSWWRD